LKVKFCRHSHCHLDDKQTFADESLRLVIELAQSAELPACAMAIEPAMVRRIWRAIRGDSPSVFLRTLGFIPHVSVKACRIHSIVCASCWLSHRRARAGRDRARLPLRPFPPRQRSARRSYNPEARACSRASKPCGDRTSSRFPGRYDAKSWR